MSLKIVFAGTPQFAVPTLRALIDSSHRVLAVYTQPDGNSVHFFQRANCQGTVFFGWVDQESSCSWILLCFIQGNLQINRS